jgi:ABC-2 type transport system permease protein
MKLVGASFVIGRRDYAATVFSKAFFFFLLGPLFPVLLGLLFGSVGARVVSDDGMNRIAVRAAADDLARLDRARTELATLSNLSDFPQLVGVEKGAETAALLASREQPVAAVLEDPFGRPRLTGAFRSGDPLVGRVQLLLSRARAEGGAEPFPQVSVSTVAATAGLIEQGRQATARLGQGILFILTLMLATMLLSQLIEEKSNKVIEILAAAVPVEGIFIGKLFAMLAISFTGLAVWVTVAVGAVMALAPPGFLASLPAPAVGWPGFLLLGAAYFAMSYLLIGAAFLGIGAQASTPREVQTLSMPVTMAQVGLFALSSFAVEDGAAAFAATLFPLSSPFAMMARAAVDDALLPHLAALAWQALWVSLILKLMAAWFRRSVLNGPGNRGWFRRRRPATA